MARSKHLSIRLEPEAKEKLEELAREADLTVGQLVRGAIAAMTSGTPRGAKVASRRRKEPDVSRQREMTWLAEHREDLARLGGQWVVIEGSDLVAHGLDYVDVVEQARARGVRIPFAVRVPERRASAVMMGL